MRQLQLTTWLAGVLVKGDKHEQYAASRGFRSITMNAQQATKRYMLLDTLLAPFVDIWQATRVGETEERTIIRMQ